MYWKDARPTQPNGHWLHDVLQQSFMYGEPHPPFSNVNVAHVGQFEPSAHESGLPQAVPGPSHWHGPHTVGQFVNRSASPARE